MNALWVTLGIVVLASAGWSDTLVLRDGTRIDGSFISGANHTITFDDQNGMRHRYNVSEIQSIDFGSSNLSVSPRRPAATSANRSAARESRVIPAGTELVVRTNEAIDSKSSAEGRTYSAVIDKDVLDSSGAVTIPKGSEAMLVVKNVSSGGATSSPELTLDLQSVMVGGKRYLVNAGDIHQQSSQPGVGKNRRTAEMVGGGAALGTLLGAIAGGGKGAAIGAIAGAAAGAGAQVLTRGKEVHVPAESVLTFRLDQPVRLEATY